MACQCSPCNCCDRFLKSTSIAITGTAPNQVVNVTIPSTNLDNLTNYCFVIAQALPNGSGTLPVVVTNGSTTLAVICVKGNKVRADQIRSRKRYNVTFGNDPQHLMINNCLCKSAFVGTTTTTIVAPSKPTDGK